jgi:hypothetical protein
MPQRVFRALVASAIAVLVSLSAHAQTLTIYDDALQNTFQDWSYGGGSNFASTAETHSGTNSISFVGNNFNAVSLVYPGTNLTAATYPVLRFWVHGGATGGQFLRLYLQLDNNIVAQADLEGYVDGGSIGAGEWREVTVPLGPLAASFDRIDLQSDQAAAQGVLYIDDITLGQVATPVVSTMTIEQGVTVGTMVSDRFTWRDSNNQERVAVLAHNTGQSGPAGTRGGELREFRYQVNNATRVVSAATTSGASGFGYVVAHPHDSETCMAGPDSSSLGHFTTGSITRVFEGRHHAIFRFTQNYPRYCKTGDVAPLAAIDLPVTIDWMFSTGRDHPLWAVTWDMNDIDVDTLEDDARGPYGELLFDGAASEGAHSQIRGVAWGDRYKFTTTTAPATYSSSWTWNVANTIPYVKLWTTAVDATMGTVQTQTIVQQDAGGYYGVKDWTKASGDGNACFGQIMPCDYNWPYQSIQYSIYGGATNNTRLAWGTNFGFLGQSSYFIHGSAEYGGPLPNTTAPGWPRKSYSTYVVLGTHTTSPVEAQVTQVETIQSLTLSTITGSVVTLGPAGVTRPDNVTYEPPGYNHVYGALAFSAQGNVLDANIAVGNGTLTKPLIIVSDYTGGDPTVKLAGVTLSQDADYFHSLRATASELWITLSSNLTGAVNHLEIDGVAGAVPDAPTGVTATAVLSTQVDVSWIAVAGADSYEVDRKGPEDLDFVEIGTPAVNSYSDGTALAATSYLYRVRAVNGSGDSPNSGFDLATTVIFTDDPVANGTLIKTTHITQLRTAVDAVRDLADLAPAAITDADPAGVTVKAVHVTELRTAVDEARTILGLSTGGYTDGAPAGVVVKALHVTELRDRTK